MIHFLLDPGHGGMAFEYYLTPGKRSPKVPPGIYEGEFNRRVCETLVTYANPDDIRILNIAPGPINIPLASRVSFVNQFAKHEKCALISIHANAAGTTGWSEAKGFTIFHSKTASKRSKELARLLGETLGKELEGKIPSRGIKQANHAITAQTVCPAALIECGFMTNKEESQYLSTMDAVRTIAYGVYWAITRFVQLGE